MNSTTFVMGARTEWVEFYSHRPKSRDGTSTAGSHLVWLLARAPAECQRAPISFLRCLLYNLSNDLVAHGQNTPQHLDLQAPVQHTHPEQTQDQGPSYLLSLLTLVH